MFAQHGGLSKSSATSQRNASAMRSNEESVGFSFIMADSVEVLIPIRFATRVAVSPLMAIADLIFSAIVPLYLLS